MHLKQFCRNIPLFAIRLIWLKRRRPAEHSAVISLLSGGAADECRLSCSYFGAAHCKNSTLHIRSLNFECHWCTSLLHSSLLRDKNVLYSRFCFCKFPSLLWHGSMAQGSRDCTSVELWITSFQTSLYSSFCLLVEICSEQVRIFQSGLKSQGGRRDAFPTSPH